MNFCSWISYLNKTKQHKNVILELDLERGIFYGVPRNPIEALKMRNATSMSDLSSSLRKAAKDELVKGLLIHIGSNGIKPSIAYELSQMISKFSVAKPTIAWAETFGESANNIFGYQVASAANEIWLQPSGELGIGGLHLEILLLKGLLNKAGIEPQFAKRKEYKTAADRFSADEVTKENREMVTRLGQSIMDNVVEIIAANRKISLSKVWQAINESPLEAKQAVDQGFVDQLGYRDQVYAHAYQAWQGKSQDLHFINQYGFGSKAENIIRSRSSDSVGVVQLNGKIILGRADKTLFNNNCVGSTIVNEQLRAAMRNNQIKALVLDINSPGGSYIASDAIWRTIHQVRESGRPVVAVMSDVAASGGYFCAMAANEIVASPNTITGSIGVLGGKFVSRGLLDKLAIKREGINIGARAGMLSTEQGFTDEEWEAFNKFLDRVYDDFVTKAAQERKMSVKELEPLAHGRVWTGSDAKERKLIDHFGGIEFGLQRACELAGISRDSAGVRMLSKVPFLGQFRAAKSSESYSGNSGYLPVNGLEGALTKMLQTIGLDIPGALTMPFDIKIS